MVKTMMKSIPGGEKMGEAAFMQQIESLGNMDEAQLKTFLSYAKTAKGAFDVAKSAWTKVDALVFGQLRNLVLTLAVLVVYLLVKWLFFKTAAGPAAGGVPATAFGEDALSQRMDAMAAAAMELPKEAAVAASVSAMGDVSDEFD
jgi:hypothetical protein